MGNITVVDDAVHTTLKVKAVDSNTATLMMGYAPHKWWHCWAMRLQLLTASTTGVMLCANFSGYRIGPCRVPSNPK